MQELKEIPGIPKRELLYHILTGLKIVDRNMKRFPEEIQVLSVEIKLSTNNTKTRGYGIGGIVGFERSKVKEFSNIVASKFSFSEVKRSKYYPKSYKWKETGANLQLEYASEIMREVGEKIILARMAGIRLEELEIKKSFSITVNKSYGLNLSFFDGNLTGTLSDNSSKKVSHEIIVNMGKRKDDEAGKAKTQV